MNKIFDLSVYFVADSSLCDGRDIRDVVRAAAQGGVTMVQLRDKKGDAAAFLQTAKDLLAILKPFNIPLLINDRPDIALAANADGVHLGQGDMKPAEARKLLGPNAIIGLTAFADEHFKNLDSAVVDYAGTGPFYPTQTDKGKPVLGPGEFARLVKLSPVPVVGIGGITPDNAAPVLRAGAAGVAMMRSVSEAARPEEVVKDFAKLFKTSLRA